jgi:hypothetical protein
MQLLAQRRKGAKEQKLTPQQQSVLAALAQGATLKAHRSLDGAKVHRLHPLDGGPAQAVDPGTVAALHELGLVESNMKFPAATYLLTDRGRQHILDPRG